MQVRKSEDAMNNPVTGAEWLMAMQNPHSPVYLAMMAVLTEAVVQVHLCQQFVMLVVSMKAEELAHHEQKRDDRIIAEEQRQQRQQQVIAAEEKQEKEKMVIPAERDTASLREDQKVFSNIIIKQDTILQRLATEWKEKQKAAANDYVDTLSEMTILSADNTPITFMEELKEKLRHVISDTASPSTLLKINPSMQDADMMMKCNGLVCEFKMHLAIHDQDNDNFNPSTFLKALRMNPGFKPFKFDNKDKEKADIAIAAHREKHRAENMIEQIEGLIEAKTLQSSPPRFSR